VVENWAMLFLLNLATVIFAARFICVRDGSKVPRTAYSPTAPKNYLDNKKFQCAGTPKEVIIHNQ
jgi:hypothetical protein